MPHSSSGQIRLIHKEKEMDFRTTAVCAVLAALVLLVGVTGGVAAAQGTSSQKLPYCAEPGYPAAPFGPSVGLVAFAEAVNGIPGPLAPGAIVALKGVRFSYQGGNHVATSAALPTSLAGTQVMVGGRAAPLAYVGANGNSMQLPWYSQANVQVPHDLDTAGPVPVWLQMTAPDGSQCVTPSMAMATARLAPALFQYGDGVVIVQDPSSGAVVTEQNRLLAGSVATVYATGLGRVPGATTGQPTGTATPLDATVKVRVRVDGGDVEVFYAGASPGFAGLYQINFRGPATAGAHRVEVLVNDQPVPRLAGGKVASTFDLFAR